MKKIILILIALFAFIWFIMYFFMPTLKFGFFGWPSAILLLGVLGLLINGFDDDFINIVCAVPIFFGVLFLIIVPIFYSPLFGGSDRYQKLIGTVNEKTFSSDISPTNPNDIIIIDYDVAAKLGDKKLVSDNVALGSQVNIGDFTLQKVKDQFFYVAPLNHSGFWKWRRNKNGTPGYMIVNANNDKDVRLVTNVNGVDIKLKYQMSSCFSDYLPRHLYQNGYRTIGLTDYSFEIDDNMMPWYVVTKYDKKIGYFGNDATGVILVNPMTGDIKEYGINDAPAWIDRIQPKDFITSQINNWGIYVHGIWNFSGRDQRKLSEGVQLVYGDDGVCYLYSGVTSTGSDNASMGFVLTNSRTKETTFYKSTGSIETAIQKSAQDKVSEKGYIASFPRPYNINGVWTYIMALKDSGGLIKMIAMVSYENYQIVGVGENIFDALRNYKSALNSTGNVIVTTSDNDFKNIQSDIIRINFIYNNNTNYAYFIVSDYPNKLFVTTSNISNEVLVSKVGDIVDLKVLNITEGEIFVDIFDNLNLKFDKTEGQIKLENNVNTIKDEKEKVNLDRRIQSKLENMTEEEKRELVK